MLVLTALQVRDLVGAAPDQTVRGLFALTKTAGLRKGELPGLSWADIDFAHGRLTVARTP